MLRGQSPCDGAGGRGEGGRGRRAYLLTPCTLLQVTCPYSAGLQISLNDVMGCTAVCRADAAMLTAQAPPRSAPRAHAQAIGVKVYRRVCSVQHLAVRLIRWLAFTQSTQWAIDCLPAIHSRNPVCFEPVRRDGLGTVWRQVVTVLCTCVLYGVRTRQDQTALRASSQASLWDMGHRALELHDAGGR